MAPKSMKATNILLQCDVLVASLDPVVLRSSGIELVQHLWTHGISAEIARDARSPEDLLTKHRDESYSWIVIIKQDNMLKIKTMGRKDAPDADIPVKELLNWLKSEIRDRDSRSMTKFRSGGGISGGMMMANIPHSESTNTLVPGGAQGEQDVHILVAQTKSKKFNRQQVVEQAQGSANRLLQSFLEGPIAAIETSDAVMDMIRQTSLSDPESWRKVEHNVGTSEKKYVREIHDILKGWRWEWEEAMKNPKSGKGGNGGQGSEHAFVYNFRTMKCIYYDLSR